ncbi:hypothetical protein AJ78_06039 [Emergomyces pasteurianus Ep9510]|uniref:Uncharacterized protein n=1 Tax=Emergomyces pasteurianus Ep9510 TaxID=1447872 RepID=A0A1J9PAB9_9EURO|nr:hypothetical protein AJ78_06039 [Emergomyces pasteurianus Ep9510]
MTRNLSVKIKKRYLLTVTLSTQPQSGPRSTESSQPVPEPEPKTVTACERCLDCVDSDKENVEPLPPLSPRSISGALPDDISENGPLKKIHARVGDSFAPHLEPDTSGLHILLHRETMKEHLEFLLWAPIWQPEDDIAKVHPDQLKRYKERLNVEPAKRASQARKRARSPFPEPRRSSCQKKPRQC